MSGGGELVLVATPIGNLSDLSPRAAEVLGRADVLCCEDTRHTGQLLSRLGIAHGRLVSLHGHNEAARAEWVAGLVAEGKTVCLVSDAGMPAISDPGARAVDAVRRAGGRVLAVPGPSAAVTAVALAGFAEGRFLFEGFLPRTGRARRERLAAIAAASHLTVCYEAPGRIGALLADLAAAAGGDRQVLVARELTKLHEESWRGSLAEAAARFAEERARGEFVLVVDAAPAGGDGPVDPAALGREVAELVAAGSTRRDAVDEVAARHGRSRREVYAAATGEGRPGGL